MKDMGTAENLAISSHICSKLTDIVNLVLVDFYKTFGLKYANLFSSKIIMLRSIS